MLVISSRLIVHPNGLERLSCVCVLSITTAFWYVCISQLHVHVYNVSVSDHGISLC